MRIRGLNSEISGFYIDKVAVRISERRRGWVGNACTNPRSSSNFIYLVSGELTVKDRGGSFKEVLKEGEFLHIPQFVYCGSVYSGENSKSIMLSCRFNDSIGCFALSGAPVIIKPDVIDCYTGIFEYIDRPDYTPSLNLIRESELLYRLLGKIGEHIKIHAKESNPTSFNYGMGLLEKNLHKDIPISELAKAANISEGYFRRLCSKHTGYSPIKYRNLLRLKYARDLIQSGLYNSSEAAEIVGFNNIGYFGRLFKEAYGETTLDFRKRIR